MSRCKNCGGKMIQLFTGVACKDECDLQDKPVEARWAQDRLAYVDPAGGLERISRKLLGEVKAVEELQEATEPLLNLDAVTGWYKR